MLDPISAIGLTASIVQLVTFSEGLIRRTSDIYHSVDGSLVQHTELESIVTSFSELLDVLRNNQNAFNLSKQKSNQVSADTELDKLAADTRLVIEEILQVIRRLKGNGNSSRAWYSVRQALLTIINENKLKDLEQRLDRLRKQIDTSLLNSLW